MTGAADATRSSVVALHGFAGGPESFDELRQLEGSEHWLCPYLTGHGPDPDRSARDFVAEVDRVAGWITAQSRSPVRLLGYSMGARVALALCVRHPMLVRDATLIGVHPGLRDFEDRRKRQRWEGRWVNLLENHGLTAFLEQWESLPLFATQRGLDPRQLEHQARVRRSHRADGLAHAFRVLGTGVMPDLWPALERLQIPICLVTGEADERFLRLAEGAVEKLPQGRLEVVAGAGHNVLLERPASVLRALNGFSGCRKLPTEVGAQTP